MAEYFPLEPTLETYSLNGIDIELLLEPDVFPPSGFGQALADNIIVHPGERVIDIGTGTGIIAITAAKLGGIVAATDIFPQAVELAKKNAERNNVAIDVLLGEYFASSAGKYDVIVANLPQEVLPPSYIEKLDTLAKSQDGGEKGNESLLKLLDIAPDFMHDESRFYTLVHSLTDFNGTIEKMLSLYDVRLLSVFYDSVKPFVKENLPFYIGKTLQSEASIYWKDNQWHTFCYFVELRKKK